MAISNRTTIILQILSCGFNVSFRVPNLAQEWQVPLTEAEIMKLPRMEEEYMFHT